MKKVIKGARYDTNAAKLDAEKARSGRSRSDIIIDVLRKSL